MGKPVHAPVFLKLTRGPSGMDGKGEWHVPKAWTVWTQVQVVHPARRPGRMRRAQAHGSSGGASESQAVVAPEQVSQGLVELSSVNTL